MLPACLAIATLAVAPTTLQPSADAGPQTVVGGTTVDTCGWPTTVYSGGCTATLVHPQAISTAQHCGQPSAIQFGEAAGNGPTVNVLGCVGDGSQDAMLCELAEPVTEVPVTPVLFGCEAEQYLTVGQPVVIVGFGDTSFGSGGGTKRWADQTITAVEPGRTIIGNAGDGISPCPGDSGGPVFVQVADGSWRVFGTVLGGTTGTPCNSAADFQRIDTVVANFEAQSGLDITPCFDGQTGAWDPGPECGSFFSGDHVGAGTWSDWCEGTSQSGYSDACGAAYGDGGDDGADGDSGTGDDGLDDGPDDGTDGATSDSGGMWEPADDDADDDDDDGGGETATDGTGGTALPPADGDSSGGCRVAPAPGSPLWLAWMPLLFARRRRRSTAECSAGCRATGCAPRTCRTCPCRRCRNRP